MSTVGVVGMGDRGLALALTLATNGHRVLVWDSNPTMRDAITTHTVQVDEPSVNGILDVVALTVNDLTIATLQTMSNKCLLVFVAVPTPEGIGHATHILDTLTGMGTYSRAGRPPPTVVVVNALVPGTCRNVLAPVAARVGARLVYAPLIASPGTLLRDYTNPEVVIIGHEDDGGGHLAATVFDTFAKRAPVRLMSYESAEIARLSITTFAAMKTAFANSIGQLCDQHEANVDTVLDVLALHRVVGGSGLIAGSGFGGPDLPRDVRALASAGSAFANITTTLNSDHLRWVANRVMRTKAKTFAILGRSSREGTTDRTETFADHLEESLCRKRLRVTLVGAADVVIIAQPLHNLNLCEFFKPGAVVLDLCRGHSYLSTCDGITYLPFGTAGLS